MKVKTSRTLALIVVLVFTSIFIFSLTSLAFNPGEVINTVDGQAQTAVNGEDKFAQFGATFLYAVKLVGTILAIVLIVIFGIKWMIASPQARAQLKEQLWNYVLGAVFLFGCGFIAQWIYDIVNQVT